MRLSHVRSVLDREYSQKWTGEIFKIHARFRREGVPVYTLVDWDGERVEGTFYIPELHTVNIDPSTEYHNEKKQEKRSPSALVTLAQEIRHLDSGSWRERLLVDQSEIRKQNHVTQAFINTSTLSFRAHLWRRLRHEEYQCCIQR